jgi:hypothetical protein
LMNEIVSNARNITNRFEILLVRKLVGVLLRDLIGVRMLGEQAQIGAIQELASSYLKRWPAFMPNQLAPSPYVLSVALKEVAGLLQQLGNAPPPVQVGFGTLIANIIYLRLSRKRSLSRLLPCLHIPATPFVSMPVEHFAFSVFRLHCDYLRL